MNGVCYEQYYDDYGRLKQFSTFPSLEYTPGDIVETPRGVGVVNAGVVDDFEFPQGLDEVAEIEASADEPAYVVGFGGRSAPFRGTSLNGGDLYEPRQYDRGSALADPVSDKGLRQDAMRGNWIRRDLLRWWSDAGGLWSSAADYVQRTEDASREEAESIASKRKDAVLGTDRWRSRF